MARQYPSQENLVEIADVAASLAKTLRNHWFIRGADAKDNPARELLPHDVDPKSDGFRHCLRGMFDAVAKATANLGRLLKTVLSDYQMDDMELSLLGRELIERHHNAIVGWPYTVSAAIGRLGEIRGRVREALVGSSPWEVSVQDVQGIESAAEVLWDAADDKPTSGMLGKAPAGNGEPRTEGTIMAGDFDYGSFWENARDVLDVLDAFSSAMDSLLYLRTSFYLPSLPPAFRRGKRDPQPPDYAERCQRAIDAIRKAASEFFILLAEERFVEPLANVWPPAAPRELTFKLSHALALAHSFCFAARDGDEQKLSDQKRNLHLARSFVLAVLTDLERRPDLAERTYQRARSKLQRQVSSRPNAVGTATAQHADRQPEEAEQPKVDDQPETPVQNERTEYDSEPPITGATAWKGPLEGSLSELDDWSNIRYRNFKTRHGKSLWLQKLQKGKYRLWFSSQADYHAACQRKEQAETNTNEHKGARTRTTSKKHPSK